MQHLIGYLLDTKTYSVEIKSNETTKYANVNNEPTGTFTLTKKNEDGTKTISGTKYRIWSENGYDKEFTTDNNGIIKVEGLKMGNYFYQEIQASNGYLIDNNKYSFELKYADQNTSIIYSSATKTNAEPRGVFTLTKKNSDSSANISGTKYRVWNENGYDKEFITDGNGVIKIEGLKMGKYYYQEIQASEGYLIDNNKYSFELKYADQNTPIIYEESVKTNIEPTGTVSIIKRDNETGGIPQGNATLKGAEYGIYAKEDIWNKAKTVKYYAKGELVAKRVMNEKGNTEDITGLPLGSYIVKEEKSSEGYLLDTKEYSIDLLYKDQNTNIISKSITSKEIVKKMQVHIFKSGINKQSGEVPGLAEAEFTFKLATDVEKALEQGYTYNEIWNGIDKNGNSVEVNKQRVIEAQQIAPNYDVITTDSDGNAYTILLPYGKYLGKETKTPKDFETASDFSFTITKDESEIYEIGKKVKDIIINNEQLETYIKLIKKDIKTQKTVTASSATFQIKAAENIIDRGNGKILFAKGEIIKQKVGSITYDKFTTNSNDIMIPTNSYLNTFDDRGTVTTPLVLPVGNYIIYEIYEPNGFTILEEPIEFCIDGIRNYDVDRDGAFIKEIVINNEQPTGKIILNKNIALRENADKSLINSNDLSGIEFELFAKENIYDRADNSVIYYSGDMVGHYNLSKEGKLEIIDLPIGTYEIIEVKTLDGLILNNNRYEIKFTQEDNKTKTYEKLLDISNDTTLVEFSKKSITGDSELVGASLTVLDENNNIIDSWVSTDETHKIEGLTAGKTYTLREEISPDGYVRATEISFKVELTKEIQTVTMIDKIVSMSKQDICGEEIEGAKLKVIDKNEQVVDEWTSTKEKHNIKGLVEGETYTLIEEYAPEGYVISNSIEFKVSADKETQEITMIDKIVSISKQDICGEEIEGAKLKVIDKNEQVVDEWTSTKEKHNIKGLVEGETYTLIEEYAPEGYVISNSIEFTVSEDKETQEIIMIDKMIGVKKTDLVSGDEVIGAELVITDENGNIIDSWITTEDIHYVVGLEEGKTYTLTEITCPYGYEIAESITFTVSNDKDTEIIEMQDKPIMKNIKLIKQDSETNETIKAKFKFGIYADLECKNLIKEVESNEEEGTATFTDLRYGVYYIKEISAPNGYQLSDKIIKIEINDKGIFVDNELTEENDSICSFVYYNTPIPKIQTGNEITILLFECGVAISIIGIIASIALLKSKKQKEN